MLLGIRSAYLSSYRTRVEYATVRKVTVFLFVKALDLFANRKILASSLQVRYGLGTYYNTTKTFTRPPKKNK